MTNTMTAKARIEAALRGEPVDRLPVSLWRHFYECEESAEGLAGAMLAWQTKYNWDWMKINPRASYHVEGWGVKLRFSGQPLVKPVVTSVPINSPADWGKIDVLPLDTAALDEQLEVMERLCEAVGGKVPIVETVFNPLSIAADLVADTNTLRQHIAADPQAVHGALEAITATFTAFVAELLKGGADGIFFATTDVASRDLLTAEQYAEWGRPYDLRVLAAAQGAGLNVLHVCKENNLLADMLDYPVHALSWDASAPGNPGLHEIGQAAAGKALIGGLNNDTLHSGDQERIHTEIHAAYAATAGRGFILGPGCSIAVDTPDAAMRTVHDLAGRLHSTGAIGGGL